MINSGMLSRMMQAALQRRRQSQRPPLENRGVPPQRPTVPAPAMRPQGVLSGGSYGAPPVAPDNSFYSYGAQAPRPNSPPPPPSLPGPGAVPAPNNASGAPVSGPGGFPGMPQPGKGVLSSMSGPKMPVQPLNGSTMGSGGFMGGQPGYAEGGGMRPPDNGFRGPGSGRDDAIDAKVSDGEWIADAETVALIGDGSTEEGIRRLEEMRKRLRAHKGQALARGKFSPDALAPEQYLQE